MGSRGASSSKSGGGGVAASNSAGELKPKIFLKPRPSGVRGALYDRRTDEENFGGVYLRVQLKNGKWGKPLKYEAHGNEKPEDILKRISKNNPKSKFRMVYENESV